MEARTLLEAISVAERLKDTTRHCYTRNFKVEINFSLHGKKNLQKSCKMN